MLRITRTGLVQSDAADDLTRLRTQFYQEHCIRLPALFDAPLAQLIQRQIAEAHFDQREHGRIGLELCMRPDRTLDLLYFLVNDPKLFDVLRQVTGCGVLGCFVGRVYRMVPGLDHHDSWHDDVLDHRILGMSVNLSPQSYDGGVFQLRESGATAPSYECANTGSGDAIVFRIAAGLEHRVTAVSGTAAKTAFAGWFKSEPEFRSLLTPEGSVVPVNVPSSISALESSGR